MNIRENGETHHETIGDKKTGSRLRGSDPDRVVVASPKHLGPALFGARPRQPRPRPRRLALAWTAVRMWRANTARRPRGRNRRSEPLEWLREWIRRQER